MNRLILLDANFLLTPVQTKVDFYSEFEHSIPPPWELGVIPAIFHEIEQKIQKNPQNQLLIRQYRLAQQLLARFPNRVIPPTPTEESITHVDEQLILTAQRLTTSTTRVYIATNDKNLRQRCRAKKIPTIYVRQKRKIALDEFAE